MKFDRAISPYDEMVAYETLWALPNESWKTISETFHEFKLRPSEVLEQKCGLFDENLQELQKKVAAYLKIKKGFSVAVHGDFSYPIKLRDAKYPIELFYYKGDIGLIGCNCVSVVGARQATEIGKKRARKLTKLLVNDGYTIVSGLAAGIDTEALTTAIESGGNVIAVIGTPIDEYYPRENRELQDNIAAKHLLISQVPFYRYGHEPFQFRRHYFPQRNITMAALSMATFIVEASDTSGTLSQARACIAQGRALFILESCFENPNISWPAKYEKEGAIRVKDVEEVLSHLEKIKPASESSDSSIEEPPKDFAIGRRNIQ